MNKKDLILVRSGRPDDFDFIEATWKQALYYGNDFYHLIDKQSFYQNYKTIINRILNHPDLTIQIACLKEEPTLCLAYSVSSANTLHFVYTKKDWRGIGLMNDLLPKQVETLTHFTEAGKSIWKKRWPEAKFNPF